MRLARTFGRIALCALLALPLLAGGAAQAATITLSGTWTGTEALQGTQRLGRNGVQSVAPTAKAFPGTSSNNPTYFAVATFEAVPGTVVSVTDNSLNDSSFFSIYADLFSPAALATNYLGDAGRSTGGGTPATFSVLAPASGVLVLVASSLGGTDAIGQPYTATPTFTAPGAVVPAPAALPVFALALAGLGLTLRRRG